jgi:hypothetical protein
MVPLGSFLRWLSSTAGYVPGNEARLSPSDIAPLQRVLPKGCYPFLSGRSEKPFGLSWQAFRPQLRASIATANRSAFTLSQSLTTPFAVPSLVSKTVIFVTLSLIPKRDFRVNCLPVVFERMCFILLNAKKISVFERVLRRKNLSGQKVFVDESFFLLNNVSQCFPNC